MRHPNPEDLLTLARLSYNGADWHRQFPGQEDLARRQDAVGWEYERTAHELDELATVPAYEGEQVFG